MSCGLRFPQSSQRRERFLLRPLRCAGVLVIRRADVTRFAEQAMVRSCQCSSKVAISVSKSGPRVDAGLTREVENGKGSLGTRGNLLSGCRNDDRIRGCRPTNAARHAGIGVPTHHKRTVTLRPPHEHRGGRALPRVGFESVRQVQKRLREEWCGRHAAMPGGVRIW
jgi:hypothetical protein